MRLFTFVLSCFLSLTPILGASATTLDRVEAVAVTSPAGGVRLNGILRLPSGAGPFPAAVLVPERGVDASDPTSPNNQLLTSLADYLVRQGVVVLRLHERGLGGSGGSAAATTLAERAADAIAALNYLRTRPQVDATRLGLIGHGEGGNVALLAGAQPLAPTFVVAMGAAGLPGREVLANQPAMYGKVLGNDSTDAQRARKYRLDMVAAEQEAAKMRLHGSNAAQVQTYLDQQRLRQKAAIRRDEEALLKQQRAMLEIVRQTPDNGQAQAILGNMLRQRYPGIAPQDLQASVQTLTTPAYRSYLSFDPQPSLPGVKCPVLLLQGDADQQVNAAANLASLRKGLRNNARVAELRYPNLNHALQFASNTPAEAASAAFNPDTPTDIYKWIVSQQ